MKKLLVILGVVASLMLINVNATVWAYGIDPSTDPVFGLQQTSQYGMIILMFWDQTSDTVLFDLMLTDLWKENWKEQIALGGSFLMDADAETLFLQEYDNIVDAEDLASFMEQSSLLPQELFNSESQWAYAEALHALESASTVPEPSTYLMMGAGLLALIAIARRKKTNWSHPKSKGISHYSPQFI